MCAHVPERVAHTHLPLSHAGVVSAHTHRTACAAWSWCLKSYGFSLPPGSLVSLEEAVAFFSSSFAVFGSHSELSASCSHQNPPSVRGRCSSLGTPVGAAAALRSGLGPHTLPICAALRTASGDALPERSPVPSFPPPGFWRGCSSSAALCIYFPNDGSRSRNKSARFSNYHKPAL